MAFEKYDIANSVQSTLAVGLWVSATSLVLASWDGDKMKSGSQKTILTVVKYNTSWDIDSGIEYSERVIVTNRSWDSLTITKGAFWDTQRSFDADDHVYLTNDVEIIEDIQNETSRLETDKLNKGWLREAISWLWKLFYTNWSWNENTLWLWSAWTYLKSTGTSSAPKWWNPPLDINGQDPATTPISTWLVALYNGTENVKVTLANLVKGLATATTSQAWVVERATDTEASNKTDTTRYVTPKHLWDLFTVAVSDAPIYSPDDFVVTDDPNKSLKWREITIKAPWEYRIKFNLMGDTWGWTCQAEVKKNGSVIWNVAYDDSTWWIDYELDHTFAIWDSLEIWGLSFWDDATVRDIQICWTIIPFTVVL